MKEERTEMENPQLVDEVLADSSPEGGQEKRLARYAAAKSRQGLVSDFILQEIKETGTQRLHKEAVALLECGSYLVFRHYFTEGIYKLTKGCTCKKHLLCALCAIRRAAKCIAVYSEKISQAKEEQKEDFDEVLITFTIVNGEDLAERYDHLLDSMQRLLQKRRASFSPKGSHTEMKSISGAVYSYEVTYSKEKGFHPHCHMIALIPKGIYDFTSMNIKGKDADVPLVLKEGIVSDWKHITNGESYIVDVRRIVDTAMPEPGADIYGSRLEALVEVFKYALKMNRIDKDSPADSQENVRIQVAAYEVLKGRRMIGSFGVLWGVKIPENLNDSPLTAAELPFVELVYQYSGVTLSYELTTHGEAQTAQQFPSGHHENSLLKKIMKGQDNKWKKAVKEYVNLQNI